MPPLPPHAHRDLWIAFGPAMLVGGGALPVTVWTVLQTSPNAQMGMWADLIVVGGAIAFCLGTYIVLALAFRWPLPGGFVKVDDAVTPDDTDADVANECLALAQSISELLASATIDEPMPNVFINTTGHVLAEDWRRQGELRTRHERAVMARFLERYGVRLSGLVWELKSRGRLTDEENQFAPVVRRVASQSGKRSPRPGRKGTRDSSRAALARLGLAPCGVRLRMAWLGQAWLGMARLGMEKPPSVGGGFVVLGRAGLT